MATWAELDVEPILERLAARGVDYVVIGGIAAMLLGSPRLTQDLDICFATDAANLEALGKALVDLEARLAEVPHDVPFVPDAATLRRVDVLTLETKAGKLDVLARPTGAPTFQALRGRAERFDVGAFAVLVASLDDLIEMKATAGRPKDLADVAELEAIKRLRRQAER